MRASKDTGELRSLRNSLEGVDTRGVDSGGCCGWVLFTGARSEVVWLLLVGGGCSRDGCLLSNGVDVLLLDDCCSVVG